jgi:serine/threonine-protein kinase RsbW
MTTSSNSGPTHHNGNGNGSGRRLDMILESKVESADLAEKMIYEFSREEYSEGEHHAIQLAVREAMANAVLHGNRFDHNKKIYLSVELREPALVISIRDEGEGCVLEAVPDPLAEQNMLRESGRGMLLIRNCMDEAAWEKAPAGGTHLVMAKRRSRPHSSQK